MQGKLGGDETVDSLTELAAKYEKAKKEVADLEKRKANIGVEINRAVITATEKLEADYDKKGRDLTITYQSRLDRLDIEKASVENLRKELVVKDTEIIEIKKKLAEYSDNIEKQRELVEEDKRQFEIVKNSQDKSLEAAKKNLVDREKTLVNADALVFKREEAVGVIESDIEDRENKVLVRERVCSDKETSLAEGLIKLSKDNAVVSDLKSIAENRLAEVNALKQQLSESCKRAAEDQELADASLAGIKDIVLKNETLSKNLSELRSALAEKEVTLKEKERALLIQARDIDGKIATLQKLRKE